MHLINSSKINKESLLRQFDIINQNNPKNKK